MLSSPASLPLIPRAVAGGSCAAISLSRTKPQPTGCNTSDFCWSSQSRSWGRAALSGQKWRAGKWARTLSGEGQSGKGVAMSQLLFGPLSARQNGGSRPGAGWGARLMVQTGSQNLRDEGAELWGPLANRYGYTVPPSGTPFFQLGRAAVLCLLNKLKCLQGTLCGTESSAAAGSFLASWSRIGRSCFM